MRLPFRRQPDGAVRTEIRISHHLTPGQLIQWLAWSGIDYLDGQLPNLTGPQTLATVRDQIARNGTDNLDGWNDDLTREEVSTLTLWATTLFHRLDPHTKWTS
ncbi:hypothetical protein [Streptomyces sp. NBC_01304]|uniref:hypothetical protein n=1 Tax=Streptomyces sp. NBC_01304 TaxID=2903818 RepID=UPI002E15B89D|nr:hypothetical protein OG430_41555 [Streptomyces sp. NBC_01304]